MQKKVCSLCNKKYMYNYELFGRGCLNSQYMFLGYDIPKNIKNKEDYFCNIVTKKLNKTYLNKKEKYLITEKYLTLRYLENVKYGDYSKEKEQLKKIIKENRLLLSVPSAISLNDSYGLYKLSVKFDNQLKIFNRNKDIYFKDENGYSKFENDMLNGMKFIFSLTKMKNPLQYKLLYNVQTVFWNVIILGGLFVNYSFSSKLLSYSLTLKENGTTLLIDDKLIIENIKNDEKFKSLINKIVNKYKARKRFTEKTNISFNETDLFFSIHNATLNVTGTIKNNKWYLKIKITDIYDFTDWKRLKDYEGEEYSKSAIIGNLLNNFGVISMKYGVLKDFNVVIKFEMVY